MLIYFIGCAIVFLILSIALLLFGSFLFDWPWWITIIISILLIIGSWVTILTTIIVGVTLWLSESKEKKPAKVIPLSTTKAPIITPYVNRPPWTSTTEPEQGDRIGALKWWRSMNNSSKQLVVSEWQKTPGEHVAKHWDYTLIDASTPIITLMFEYYKNHSI